MIARFVRRFGCTPRMLVRALVTLFLLIALFAARPARAEPVRILVAAGANAGFADERPLSHPRTDAAAVRDVFTSLGWVRAEHAIVVPDPTRATLAEAFDRATAIAQKHTADEVTLLFYFSGHGDRDALHLRGESFPVAELVARIAQIPAGLRIVVVDACRTTEALRAKGMSVGPGFTVQLPARTAAAGSVWVHASADGEAAQESDEIGGALFTHFWLAGLRGAADTNGDAKVTLEESFAYAYHHTLLRSARSGGVLQRPELASSLREMAPLVLTEIAGERSQLELPREADSLYLIYAVGARAIVAEVYGAADRGVRIALSKGRYIVQRRQGAHGAAAEITLAPSSVRVLTASDFRSFAADTLAQKGTMVFRPWSLALGNAIYRGMAIDFADEIALRIERRQSGWGMSLGPLGSFATHATPYNDVREQSAGAELTLDRVLDIGDSTLLRLGADFRGQWIWQFVRRNDEDRIGAAGYTTRTNYSGSAWGAGVHAALRFSLSPLSNHLYTDMGVRALALIAKTDTGVETRLLGGLWLAMGTAF